MNELRTIPAPDPGACPECGAWRKAGMTHTCIPWNKKTAPNRVRPRECVGEARDALNRAYGKPERAQVGLLIEAVDWLRRALEQMAVSE